MTSILRVKKAMTLSNKSNTKSDKNYLPLLSGVGASKETAAILAVVESFKEFPELKKQSVF